MTAAQEQRQMAGRVCLVTGANGSMGRVISTELARRGATVVLVCRTPEQGDSLKREIVHATGNSSVESLSADLSSQADIRQLASAFLESHSRLHVLVNNAGAHFKERGLTTDGIERHFAVNHLGWFLLTNMLLDTLKASAPARIVNVASEAMADSREIKVGKIKPVPLDLDDLQAERGFESMRVYGRSKLAMVMCGYALARRLDGSEVTVNALHPGLVGTNIVDDISPGWARPFLGLIKRFLLTPEEGAQTAIYLATAPEVETVTGKYFIKAREHRSPEVSYDPAQQDAIWNASATLVGLAP